MTALDDLCKKRQKTQLEWAILVTLEAGGEATAADAEEELVALHRIAEAARAFSVEPTIEQKTIVDEKTFVSLDVSEVRNLAAALAEYDKCRAA